MTEPMVHVLDLLAASSDVPRWRIEHRFRTSLYGPFWRGDVLAESLWTGLVALAEASVAPDRLADAFHAGLRPGPAVRQLASWSRRARLVLLSNHRASWLLPVLDAEGVTDLFESVVISDTVKIAKPDREIFVVAAAHRASEDEVMYVDDDPRNIAVGASFGWRTVLAEESNLWQSEVEDWLGGSRSDAAASVPRRDRS